MFVLIDGLTFILRKMVEGKGFLMKPKHQFIYPNEENEFMVANCENKRNNYVNPCFSKLTGKL